MTIFKLESFFLLLKGRGIKKFLQGIITNDINKLTKNLPIYSLILTARGKYLSDFFLYFISDEEILLECNLDNKEIVLNSLSLYNLHKTVEITEVEYNSYSSIDNVDSSFEYVFSDVRCKDLGYKIITKKELETQENTKNIYTLIRIKNCIPDCSLDLISGSSFPLEYGLEYAFDFEKGCYVGQEVTLRFRLRDLLKRKMFIVKIGDAFVLNQQNIENKGQVIGKFLSSYNGYALALLEKDKIPIDYKFVFNENVFQIIK